MTPQKQHSKGFLWLVGVPLIVLLIGVAYVAGIHFGAGGTTYPVTKEINVVYDNENPQDSLEQDLPIVDYQTVTKKQTLSVNWNAADEQPAVDIYQPLLDAFVGSTGYSADDANVYTFSLGTISGGSYDAWTLSQHTIGTPGMGGTYYTDFYVLISPDAKEHVILNRDGSKYESPLESLTEGKDAFVNGLVFDLEAIVPELLGKEGDRITTETGVELVRRFEGSRLGLPETFDFADQKIVGTTEDGTPLRVRTDTQEQGLGIGYGNLFFTLREDLRPAWYDITHPFWPTQTEIEGLAEVRWSDGTKNRERYTKGNIGGCGYQTITYVRDEAELGLLLEVAEANGTPVFAPEDYDTDYYRNIYKSWTSFSEEKPSFEEFIKQRPIFYWKDGFGRWIEFQRVDMLPAVECGKPVIYLYPQETTKLHVEVAPENGFSVTEPVYDNGWDVIAKPSGELTNISDGKTYPYLFWEGRGGMYAEPTHYWVVAQKEVHGFLIETLAELGLNTQETADFMEFWEPRMQAAPYYKIGFHGTRVMDQLAPLSISEKPDMILRILMDYSELEKPIKENPPTLPPTPKRHGFHVIEWGGVIR